jgi:hypothetical protein
VSHPSSVRISPQLLWLLGLGRGFSGFGVSIAIPASAGVSFVGSQAAESGGGMTDGAIKDNYEGAKIGVTCNVL